MVRRSERGSEIVQFVVVLPLLLAMLFSIMQLAGMMLATSQVSSEITRACRQLDVVGFQRAADKERFVKDGILGASTQLDPDRLSVGGVTWAYEKRTQRQDVEDGSVLEQEALVAIASYDVRYRLPAIADLPGLTGKVLERHVRCSLVDGRTIEIERGSS